MAQIETQIQVNIFISHFYKLAGLNVHSTDSWELLRAASIPEITVYKHCSAFFFFLRRQRNWDTHTQTHKHTHTRTHLLHAAWTTVLCLRGNQQQQRQQKQNNLQLTRQDWRLSCWAVEFTTNTVCEHVYPCLCVCVCVRIQGVVWWMWWERESDRANGDKRAWGWKTRRGQAGRRADGLRFLDCSAAPQPATPMCSNWYSHSFSTLQLPSAPVLINLLYSLIYTQRGQTQGLETGRRCNIADGILSVLRLSRSRIYVQKCWEMMEISTTGLLLIIPIYSTVNG